MQMVVAGSGRSKRMKSCGRLGIFIALLAGVVVGAFGGGEAQAAIARVGTGGSASGVAVTSLNVTIPATTAGNTLIAVIGTNRQGTNAVTGITGGGTWTRVTGASGTNTGGAIEQEIWYCPNITAGVNTVTISVSTWDTSAVVQEYSGVLTASPLDASAINNTASQGTALTSGSATATTTDLGIAGFSVATNVTTFTGPTGSWNKNLSKSQSTVSTMLADNLAVSAGAASTSTTSSSSNWWVGSIALFKAASTGNLTVGNGTNPANATVYTGTTGNAIDAFTLAMSSGTATVSTLTLTGSTNFTATNISNVTVYRDTGTTVGTLDGSDVLVPSSYTLSGTTATITLTTAENVSATAANYLVVVDIQPGGTSGNTLTATVTGATGTGIGTPTYSDSASATLTLATGTTTVGEGTNPASANPIPGATGNALDAFTLVKSAGSGSVSTITFTGSAQFTSANVSSIKLYRDTGTTVGTLDGSDVLIATTTSWASNVATLTLTTPETVTPSAVNYLVVVDIASGATVGNALTGTVSALSGTGLGTVTDSDAGSATLTITSPGYLTVGNGATIANANVQQGSTTNIMDSFTMAMTSASATVNTLTLTGSTNFTATNVANITVYSDNSNPQGSIGGTDAVIPTTYSLSGNVATITFTTPESVSTTAKNYLVVVDVKSTATVGNTLSGTITAATGSSLGTPTYSDTASGTLTVTAGTCVRNTPTVTLGSNGNVAPGGQNAYALVVTNNDNTFCGTSTFTLSIASETGNTASFILPSTLGATTTGAVSPAGTYNTTFTVKAQSGATIGNTLTSTVNAADATNHAAQTGSGSITTTVINTPSTSKLMHNSTNLDTKYGVWGTSWNCATCHNETTPNVKRVFTTINTPIGNRTVVFSRMTTSSHSQNGVFGDDLRTYAVNASTNVCEVCHHQTTYHQYSSSKVTTNTHNNGKDCTACHLHSNAFAGKGHNFPYGGSLHKPGGSGTLLANSTPPYSNCNGCHDATSNTGTYPVAAGTAPVCTACHNTKNATVANNEFNGTTPAPGCWDCHGNSQTSVLTGGTGVTVNSAPKTNSRATTAFPDRLGQHSAHMLGTAPYISTTYNNCSSCHAYTNTDARHGWSNRKAKFNAYSSVIQKIPIWSGSPNGNRSADTGNCNGNVGACCNSHGNTNWY